MKRFMLLLVFVLLILAGCGDPSNEKEATPATPDHAGTDVMEPTIFATYIEDEVLASKTQGAVKGYQIVQGDYYAMCPMGEGIVLFSGKTETTLTYVTKENVPIQTTLSDLFITPDHPSVQANQGGISYYQPEQHSLIFLNLELKVASRIPLSEEIPSQPVLSQDWKLIYYYGQNALRCLNLRSGVSRLIKETEVSGLQVSRLLFDDNFLECRVLEDQQSKMLLINTQNGETRYATTEPLMLMTHGQEFLARWTEQGELQWIMGSREGEYSRWMPVWAGESLLKLGDQTLTAYRGGEKGIELAWYDLSENGSYAYVCLENSETPVGLIGEKETNLQWLLTRDHKTGKVMLYSWDPALSKSNEEHQTIAPYYTFETPDTEGLEQCEEMVQPLRDEYGLNIRLWQDSLKVVPEGYEITPEHSAENYEKYLPMLEKAIRAYPEEIYKKLSKKSDNKKLTISLVREICGSNELGSTTREQGVFFIHKGSYYLVLTINEQIEYTYYHELFHAMDSYIIVEAKTFDEWGALNPKGFAYDHSYLANETRDPENYLDGETRAFIDLYSMSYPKEDRARIMEYAMQEGNQEYFTSEIMAKKLKTLCNGIRKAFRLQDGEASFPWEQYLLEQ